MNGLNLKEMEASEMLDVLHYFFEEDMNYSTGEQAEAHGKVRTNVYKTLYGKEYKYADHAMGRPNSGASNLVDEPLDADEPEAALNPFNPRTPSVIPYTPATSFNPDAAKPFGDILDTPLG